jgi:hypothetical protein
MGTTVEGAAAIRPFRAEFPDEAFDDLRRPRGLQVTALTAAPGGAQGAWEAFAGAPRELGGE